MATCYLQIELEESFLAVPTDTTLIARYVGVLDAEEQVRDSLLVLGTLKALFKGLNENVVELADVMLLPDFVVVIVPAKRSRHFFCARRSEITGLHLGK